MPSASSDNCCIMETLFDTNVLQREGWDFIQAKTISESENRKVLEKLKRILKEVINFLINFDKRTAMESSSRSKLMVFMGVTRDLEQINLHAIVLSAYNART